MSVEEAQTGLPIKDLCGQGKWEEYPVLELSQEIDEGAFAPFMQSIVVENEVTKVNIHRRRKLRREERKGFVRMNLYELRKPKPSFGATYPSCACA